MIRRCDECDAEFNTESEDPTEGGNLCPACIATDPVRQERSRRHNFIACLHHLAGFLTAHPELPVPHGTYSFNVMCQTREEFQRTVRAMGGGEKDVVGDWFFMRRRFGPLSYEVNITRSQVCLRRVVGMKLEPAQPERVVEVVEWDCFSIFAEVP